MKVGLAFRLSCAGERLRDLQLRIHQRHGVRRGIGNLMMVQNNHIHALRAERGDRLNGSRAAVHGEQQCRRKFLEAIFHAIGLKP